MTAIEKFILAGMAIIVVSFIVLVIINVVFHIYHKALTEEPEKEIVKVTDDLIDNSIFDMFPSWKDEFNDDEEMREIEASCDLYLAATNLLKDPKNLMLILQLSDAADKYEKYVLK